MSNEHHDTGTAFLQNLATGVSPAFEPEVQSGRALALSATNDLPIPTHIDGYITYHNLDTDTITQEATDGTDKVFNTITVDNILTHKMAFSAGDLTLIQQEPNILAALALGETTPISSVTLDADDSWYACGEVSGADVFDARGEKTNGVYSSTARTHTGDEIGSFTDNTIDGYSLSVTTAGTAINRPIVQTYMSGLVMEDVTMLILDVTINSGTPIINSMYTGIGEYETINRTLVSGLNYFILQGLNNYDDADVVAVLYYDGRELFDIDVKVYTYQITSSKIALYTSANRITNQQKGLQTTALLLDGAGVPESYNSTPNTARVYDDTVINTGLKPNLDVMTIVEDISGLLEDLDASGVGLGTFSQRQEERVLTTEPKYYINKVLQAYTPTAPISTTILDVGSTTALIGYADTIDTRYANFRVYSTALTQAEIDAL